MPSFTVVKDIQSLTNYFEMIGAKLIYQLNKSFSGMNYENHFGLENSHMSSRPTAVEIMNFMV